jgi:glycerophosphoryl diester phosphodiesterase
MNTAARFERIGHRGAPREYFENTMASFRRAVELGADAIELDIHVSSDGVPVVHHDPTLPGSVRPKNLGKAEIAALSSKQLASVRLESGDSLPVLYDLLAELAARVFIYVELKGGSPARVAAVVAAHPGSVAVHSFDHLAITEMARIVPDIRRGILIDKWPRDFVEIMKRTGATDVWPAAKLVQEKTMTEVANVGGRAIPWTVNKASEAKRLIGLGVAGICTDDLTIFDRV